MQAVLAICHFCETHGPRVLATCQPMREQDLDTMMVDVDAANVRWSAGSPDSGEGDMATSSSRSAKKDFYGNYSLIMRHSPSNRASDDAKSDSSRSQDGDERNEADEERCAACTSFGGWEPGFLTNDHEARTSYVSSQFAYHKRVCAIVRQAGLRSLSCEVAPGPGRDGPVFYGDETNGFTLSYLFTLRDAKARGFQHWYSLIIVSMDKLLLLNSYDFFVSCLKAIIDKLQAKASLVFEAEQATSSNDDLRPTMASRAKELPSGFLKYRAGSIDSSRSLTTLTGDKDIFRRLHRYFVWIMKMQSMRFVEVLLEGCPTQDMMVEMEQSVDNPDANEFDDFSASHQLDDCSIRYYARDDDDEAHEEGDVVPAHLQSLADLKVIGRRLAREDFGAIVRQIIVGEQLVVTSNRSQLSRQVLLAFAVLLPRGCVRMVAHGAFYLELYRCNLLGLSHAVALPADMGATLVLDVSEQPGQTQDLSSCTIRLSRTPQFLDPPTPQLALVARIEQLIIDEDLSFSVLEAVLRSTREEWLNKAKLVFQLTKQNQDVDMKKLMHIVNCSNDDLPVLRFWQAGLSKQYKQYVLNACSKFHQQQNET